MLIAGPDPLAVAAEPRRPRPRRRRLVTPKAGPAASKRAGAKPVSFMQDVAPILVQNCIACHNPKKSESKYVMTTFAQLAKGGQQGEGITLEPGDPDASYLRRADPARRRAADALQAGPAARRRRSR